MFKRNAARHNISIHALREEGDWTAAHSCPDCRNFYPRPPRGGRPLRSWERSAARHHFYPRPPRGGRQQLDAPPYSGLGISIHALREEGDCSSTPFMYRVHQFLSTPSARRATFGRQEVGSLNFISIHALREEGDPLWPHAAAAGINFYPRPPRGGRRILDGEGLAHAVFLSTPSARRATPQGRKVQWGRKISIHALREEGDSESKS